MLWAAAVKPGKPVSCHKIENPIRLGNVALVSLGPFQTESSLILVTKKQEFLLCTLSGKHSSQMMDLLFDDEDEITFKVMDGGSFHLVGYEDPDDYDSDDETESEVEGDITEMDPVVRGLNSSVSRLSVASKRSRLDAFRAGRRA